MRLQKALQKLIILNLKLINPQRRKLIIFKEIHEVPTVVAVVVTVAVAAVVVVAVALTGAVIVTLDIIEVIMVIIIIIRIIFVVEAEEVTITPGNSDSNRISQSYALHVAVKAIKCVVAQKF